MNNRAQGHRQREVWTKARVSIGTGACVELRESRRYVLAVRDSKNLAQAPIESPDVTALLTAAKQGDLDVWRFRP